MILVDSALKFRQDTDNPIQVGIVGAGFMSLGLINQIERHVPGMRVAAISNRSLDRAIRCYHQVGISDVSTVDSSDALEKNLQSYKYSVCNDPVILCDTPGIDIIVEATGTIDFAAQLVLTAAQYRKPVVLLNAEVDATLGPILKHHADKAGIILSQSDGDQPGVIMNQYRFVKGLGLEPLVCGNIKGFLDVHKNPNDMQAYATKVNQTARMITNFTDGTKVNLEQASVANATGMGVGKRGMSAYRTQEHIDDLTSFYHVDQLRATGGIVDYVVGPKPGPGIYVFAASEDPLANEYLSYLKLGKGPLYSFYTPYHLCFFEVPNSIARVAHFHDPVMAPIGGPVVEVATVAKKNLSAGDTLDGMGGFAAYGECENSSVCEEENLLPIGLADGVVLKRDVAQDQAITFDDIEVPDDRLAYRLYQEQREVFKSVEVKAPAPTTQV